MTLSLSTLSIIPSCFSLISCTKENKQDEKIIKPNNWGQWKCKRKRMKKLLNRDYVKEILRLSFDDVDAKNKYIAEQKN